MIVYCRKGACFLLMADTELASSHRGLRRLSARCAASGAQARAELGAADAAAAQLREVQSALGELARGLPAAAGAAGPGAVVDRVAAELTDLHRCALARACGSWTGFGVECTTRAAQRAGDISVRWSLVRCRGCVARSRCAALGGLCCMVRCRHECRWVMQ